MIEMLMFLGGLSVPPIDTCETASRFVCVYGRSPAAVSLLCDRVSCELIQETGSARLVVVARDNAQRDVDPLPGEACFELGAVSREAAGLGLRFRIELRNLCGDYDMGLTVEFDPDAARESGRREAMELLAATAPCSANSNGTRCTSETLFFLLPRLGWQWQDEFTRQEASEK